MSGLVNGIAILIVGFIIARLTGQQANMGFFTCVFAVAAYMVACDIRSEARRARGDA